MEVNLTQEQKAQIELNRKAYGFEIKKDYCSIAADRVEQSLKLTKSLF